MGEHEHSSQPDEFSEYQLVHASGGWWWAAPQRALIGPWASPLEAREARARWVRAGDEAVLAEMLVAEILREWERTPYPREHRSARPLPRQR